MPTYTVFAVYEDSLQPYHAVVTCGSPEGAIREAQLQCLEDNGATYASHDGIPDYGSCALVGFQVVAGEVEALAVDDMPFDIGTEVCWQYHVWTVKAFNTTGPYLKAFIARPDYSQWVDTRSLTVYTPSE